MPVRYELQVLIKSLNELVQFFFKKGMVDAHQRTPHRGAKAVLTEIHRKYWILRWWNHEIFPVGIIATKSFIEFTCIPSLV